MDKSFQVAYSAATDGSIYALMALGLTLAWGALRMLNLAHGALYLVGAYAAWGLGAKAGLPPWAAFPLAVLAAGLAGGGLQELLIRPLLGKPGWDNAALIATVGAAMVVESGALLVFGPEVKQVPEVIAGQTLVRRVLVKHQGIFIIGAAAASMAALGLFLKHTRHGMAVRAVAQEMDAARLAGIPVRWTFFLVMAVSGALAGLAGVLLSSVRYLSPTSGFDPMIMALVVTIFGGLGSVKGTVWAAYIIGFLEAALKIYAGGWWPQAGVFLFMIAVLTARPNGLCGLGEGRRL